MTSAKYLVAASLLSPTRQTVPTGSSDERALSNIRVVMQLVRSPFCFLSLRSYQTRDCMACEPPCNKPSLGHADTTVFLVYSFMIQCHTLRRFSPFVIPV